MTTHLMLSEGGGCVAIGYFTIGNHIAYSTLAAYTMAAKLVYDRVAYGHTHRLKKRRAVSS